MVGCRLIFVRIVQCYHGVAHDNFSMATEAQLTCDLVITPGNVVHHWKEHQKFFPNDREMQELLIVCQKSISAEADVL